MDSSLISILKIEHLIPSPLNPVVEIQKCLSDPINKKPIDVAKQIIEFAKVFDSFDEITTNICYFSRINTKYIDFYVDLTMLLSSKLKMEFKRSLFEVINENDGLLFRLLFEKRVFNEKEVHLRILSKRRLHYFFIKEFSSYTMIKETKNRTDFNFNNHFARVVKYKNQPKILKEIITYGFKKKSIGFVLKYDQVKLLKSLVKKDEGIIRQMIEPPFYENFPTKATPLDFAAYYASVECFKALISFGQIVTKATCAHAIYGGNKEIIDICKKMCGNFSQALLPVIMTHREEYYDLVLKDIPGDIIMDANFQSILVSMNYKMIWSFFMLGFDSSRLQNGNTIIHIAVATRQHTFCKLTTFDKSSLNKENESGFTPLGLSIGLGLYSISKMLLESGASMDANWKKKTKIINTAIEEKNYDVVSFCAKHGAKIGKDLFATISDDFELAYRLIRENWMISFKDMPGNTELHTAVINNDLQSVQKIVEEDKELIIDRENELGFTPLHMALNLKRDAITALFLENGCNVNTYNVFGETPLMCAVKNESYDTNEKIIDMGRNINFQANCGLTALHIACIESKQDICALLLVRGACNDLKDLKDKKPSDYVTNPAIKILFM